MFGFVPPPVGSQVGWAVEHFFALRTPVLDVDYHGAPERIVEMIQAILVVYENKVHKQLLLCVLCTEKCLSTDFSSLFLN